MCWSVMMTALLRSLLTPVSLSLSLVEWEHIANYRSIAIRNFVFIDDDSDGAQGKVKAQPGDTTQHTYTQTRHELASMRINRTSAAVSAQPPYRGLRWMCAASHLHVAVGVVVCCL